MINRIKIKDINVNPNILPVITEMRTRFGDSVFDNTGRANAMLSDLAPGMNRERILTRNFIELGGFKALRQSKDDYLPVKNNIINNLTDIFSVEVSAARWIVHIFGMLLGYENEPLPEIISAEYIPTRRDLWVAIGKSHAVAVGADGKVFADGVNTHFQCDVKSWRDITAVAAGDAHTLGLQRDGTLLAVGANTYDQCDVAFKKNVAAVYAFGHETICVHTDGTVSATGRSVFDLPMFESIKTIAKYPEGILGIRDDGKVLASGEETDDEMNWVLEQEEVEQVIATYVNGTIILKKDGRLYKNNKPDNYFAPWRDIVSITDLSDSFAVLRKDGTVRVLPYDRDHVRKPCGAEKWANITAIYGRYKRLIGLTADGQLLSACTDSEWLKRNGSFDFVQRWYPVGNV
jgi:hypothetical protein